MKIAEFQNHAGPKADPGLHIISRADRARTSGPGLRTFKAIADKWGLREQDRLAVLGDPGRSTYHQWMRKAKDNAPLTLPLDTLLRISAILGIYKSLAILFDEPEQAMIWFSGAHQGTLFGGASPRSFVLDGSHDGIMSVRRYLDAWRGGAMGHGATEGHFEPVTKDDVVFA